MNKVRRKEIEEIRGLLEKAQELIQEANERLETAKDEEQEYYDNMPAGIQDSEKGELATAAIEALESACYTVEELDGQIDDILGNLDTAVE